MSAVLASFVELWDASPPMLQAGVFFAGAAMALIAYCLFLALLDRVFSDVWAEELKRTADLRRRELHQRELKAIVNQRFQR